jgi:uncharacterized lipoprotein YajG
MKFGAIVAVAAAALVAGCATQGKPCCQGKAAVQPVVEQNACKNAASCNHVHRVHTKHAHKKAVRIKG